MHVLCELEKKEIHNYSLGVSVIVHLLIFVIVVRGNVVHPTK